MAQVNNKEICDEIFEIRKRIVEKQEEYIKQYCVKAPLDLQKEVFEVILNIDQKVNSFKFVTNMRMQEFEFINAKLNYKKIINKLRKLVEKLQNNYYDELIEFVSAFLFRLSKDEDMNPVKNELRELLDSINCKLYIQKHKEYGKIVDFMSLAKCVCDIPYERSVYHTYRLVGIREVLIQYEKHLNDILSVEDINLKRAIFWYLNDNIGFEFIDIL